MNSIEFNTLLKNIHNAKFLEKLYNYYFSRIVLYISQKYNNSELIAQDVAQEFFLYLIKLEKKPFIKNPTAWVYTCCDHIVIKKLKKETLTTPLFEEALITESLTIEEDLYGIFYDTIKQFDIVTQQIIKLVYIYGYSKEETAKELQLKSSTIRQKHRRAIKKLKSFYKDVTKNDFSMPYIKEEG